MANKYLKKAIEEVLENQLRDNDPPETKITYKRLIGLGYTDFETRQLIGQCIVAEIYDVLKEQKPFDKARYVSNLNRLPKTPISLSDAGQ